VSRGVRRNALVKASERHPKERLSRFGVNGRIFETDISDRHSSRRAQKVRERSNPQRQTYPRCARPYILFRLLSDNFPSRNLGRLWKQRGHFLAYIIRSPFG
jgi:hypothetical protein